MKIYPSLISADVLNLEKTVQALDPHCDGYHIDVMDFHFVANLTWGPVFVNALTMATQRPLHVHLMVDHPVRWVSILDLRPQDTFIFHIETMEKPEALNELIGAVKQKKCKIGVAISPQTYIEAVFPILNYLDSVLVMSVNPGFSGQDYLPETLKKADALFKKRASMNGAFLIGMDGGIGLNNIAAIAQAGVDYIGVASAIFSQKDVVSALKKLYDVGQSK